MTRGEQEGRAGRAGLSLVEMMIALGVLVVGLLGFSRALVSTMDSAATSAEVALATQAARLQVERLRATPFDEVYARFNADPGDDLPGIACPGVGFAVTGLEAVEGDPDGLVGQIVFPTVVGAGGFELREDLVHEGLGTPMDLDGDGLDTDDHSDDYRILPVLVRLRWRGENGTAQLELKTILADIR